MSELRAQVVVDQLVTDGVPARSIGQVGHGSVQFALTSQESRRVEISAGAR
jgi:outer membrane protein OmpA-like peptidoglycan-associated protein